MSEPIVSFLISTYNRKTVLLATLARLREVANAETIVVDNASSDGTAEAVAREFPEVKLVRLRHNRGACAKNLGLPQARGAYTVFLDDDSYPMDKSIERMIGHFSAHAALGAAVFDVILPDGSHECSAYPDVFIGCGTGFRTRALRDVGGLPEDFFMQAEEYDLSLRLLDAGWAVRRFDDLRVMHLKTSAARKPARTIRLDARNNLMLALRYLPRQWRWTIALDWTRRYRWIAQDHGHKAAFWRGVLSGLFGGLQRRRQISEQAFEQFWRGQEIDRRLGSCAAGQRVLLIDVGKNILPFYLAAQRRGLRIVAIADSKLARPGRRYRGIPIIGDETAAHIPFDFALVANSSPAHAERRRRQWRRLTRRPVLDLFEPAAALAAVA